MSGLPHLLGSRSEPQPSGEQVSGFNVEIFASCVPQILCSQNWLFTPKRRFWLPAGLWYGALWCLGKAGGALVGRQVWEGGFCRAQRHCGNNYGQNLIFGAGSRLSVLPCK